MDRSIFSEWLEKIQQESWQLELLISGFAIFGLFQFKMYFESIMPGLIQESDTSAAIVSIMMTVMTYGFTIIFITNLLIHVFIRGLWIGAIGLRYVSGEIEYDKLNFSPRFENYFKSKIPSFDHYIEKLEKLSSIIFSYTYLLFFLLFSFFFFIFYIFIVIQILKFIYNFTGGTEHSMDYIESYTIMGKLMKFFAFANLGLAAIVALDFILLSRFKKIKTKYFSAPYFWIYRYISFVTLSMFWRPLILNFLDNKFTKYLIVLAVPYIFFVIVFMPELDIHKSDYFPNLNSIKYTNNTKLAEQKNTFHYGSYDEEIRLLNDPSEGRNRVSIPSKKVNGKLFEVFINYHASHDNFIERKEIEINKLRNKGMQTIFSGPDFRSNSLKQIYSDFEHKKDSIRSTYSNFEFSKGQNTEKLKERNKKLMDLNRWHARMVNDFQEKNIFNIKKSIMSSFVFQIDDQKIDNSKVDCDFYIHPINKIEGFLCYFKLDSMTVGKHYFNLDVATVRETSNMLYSSDTIKYVIPFIYDSK